MHVSIILLTFRLYLDFTSFSTHSLLLFHDPIWNPTTLHLAPLCVCVFFNGDILSISVFSPCDVGYLLFLGQANDLLVVM